MHKLERELQLHLEAESRSQEYKTKKAKKAKTVSGLLRGSDIGETSSASGYATDILSSEEEHRKTVEQEITQPVSMKRQSCV